MRTNPYENGRVIFHRRDCGTPEPIHQEAPMHDLSWRLVWEEGGRLFGFITLGVSLLALVYLLGWR